MDFQAGQFPAWWLWVSNGVALLSLSLAAWRVPWRTLDAVACNAWAGACVVLLGFWLASAGVQPGLSYHLLGGTAFTLLMGPRLAWLALAVVQLALLAGGYLPWQMFGSNLLLSLLPPLLLTAGLLRWARRRLAVNLFVYVFVNAFLAAAGGMLLAAFAGLLALALAGAYVADYLLQEALPFYGLLAWSEAFSTGLLLAVLVVYRPQWVATFDDRHYLARGR